MKTIKILSLLGLVAIVSAFTIKKTTHDHGYHIGDVVEDFSLTNVDGKKVSLSDYKDAKGFIVVFTCNTCPYAVAYEDRIVALDKKYATKGYPVVAIMPNNITVKPGDDLAAMKVRAAEKDFGFTYLIDKDQSIYPKYGATRTPEIFLLQKTAKGNVLKYKGAIDDNYKDAASVNTKYTENAVDALLSGNKITETVTKAIGCSIKK